MTPHLISLTHRDILLEATSSQKVCATSVITSDQGGGQLSASVTEFEIKLKFFKKVIQILIMLLTSNVIHYNTILGIS